MLKEWAKSSQPVNSGARVEARACLPPNLFFHDTLLLANWLLVPFLIIVEVNGILCVK